ncbi:hypothetical protein WA538_002490 [Blastocystis sp. DL]
MSERTSGSKRSHDDTDPDVYAGSEEDGIDPMDFLEEQVPVKRQKRDKGIGGGLQTYTKYVCEKLEQEHEISNTDIADMLVKEHTTGDPKKNDNIRRRVYDALSVIHAVGLAEKRGKTFIWIGRPSIPSPDSSSALCRKLNHDLTDKRVSMVRLIKRAVGLEYLRVMRRPDAKPSFLQQPNGEFTPMSPVMSMKTRVDEIGEFQLPLLVLSTDSTSRMLMETDANNSEVYIKISKSYQLKSSDSVLTELGYDDIAKLDTAVANSLLQTLIRSHIPKDIIEEALGIRISDDVFAAVGRAGKVETVEVRTPRPEASGLDAIVSAAQRLESENAKEAPQTPATPTPSRTNSLII